MSKTLRTRICVRLSGVLAGALLLGAAIRCNLKTSLAPTRWRPIQGQAPPLVVVDVPDCRITVIGGSLVLGADKRFELLLDEVTVCPTPTGPGEVTEIGQAAYSLDGNVVILRANGDVSVDYRASFRDGRLSVPLGGR